jgi:hypothetical protein
VELRDGKLTVNANNSDLSQILEKLADISGMTVDGLGKSSRVFGFYGPGYPRDVLSALLAGSGYNFVMIGGTADGAPRELLLSTRNDSSPPATAPKSKTAPADGDQSTVERPEDTRLGPGAITHVSPAKSQDSEDNAEKVQQHLQRLEQMHKQLEDPDAPQ